MYLEEIKDILVSFFPKITSKINKNNELVLNVDKIILIDICNFIKYDNKLKFEQLVDISGVDYLHYGKGRWNTIKSTSTGFSRAHNKNIEINIMKYRFEVVYNFLSYYYNKRIRLKVPVNECDLEVPSVVNLWSTANWHEREVYDLFGIIFVGHPDLRRILTDYGFEDFPLRKDFPLEGKHEIRYDENKGKIVYEPTSIPGKINIPKVIRKDFRYK